MHLFRHSKFIITACVLLLTTLFGSAQAEVTDADLAGMRLASETKHVKIYTKSGANLSNYKNLYLKSLNASFDVKWLRDYNRERKSLTYRLYEKDLAQISGRYTKKFKQVLSKTINEEDGFSMTDVVENADLKVEAAIVNLKLNAPDKATANWTTNMVRQAGQAELHTKMFDTKTGDLVVVIIDKKETRENVDLYQTNRVRNQYEFLPVYKAWAKSWIASLAK